MTRHVFCRHTSPLVRHLAAAIYNDNDAVQRKVVLSKMAKQHRILPLDVGFLDGE